jgi:hypothetical protein
MQTSPCPWRRSDWPARGGLVYNLGAVKRERTLALLKTFPGVT